MSWPKKKKAADGNEGKYNVNIVTSAIRQSSTPVVSFFAFYLAVAFQCVMISTRKFQGISIVVFIFGINFFTIYGRSWVCTADNYKLIQLELR